MLRYWDTNCFLGVLNQEADKLAPCRAVLREAKGGSVQIVTSALTLTEVLWPKGEKTRLSRESAEKIHKFFQHEYILVRDLDRTLAERAREFVWDHNVRVKDSIHVATALDAKVEHFDTFDGPLIALSGQLGNPPLVIGQPNVPQTLFDEYEETEVESLPDDGDSD